MTSKHNSGFPHPGGYTGYSSKPFEEREQPTVHKYGAVFPITFERLLDTSDDRELVPTGNKTLQRIEWFIGLLKYKLWRKLEKSLEKHRSFSSVGGYDWEDATYSKFKQRTKFVDKKEEK